MQIFILIMVFGGASSQSGVATVTQEFNSFEACEYARAHTKTSVKNTYGSVLAQGCFKK